MMTQDLIEDLKEFLNDANLSTYEIHAYVTLLTSSKLNPPSARQISSQSGVPSGRIYEILEKIHKEQNKVIAANLEPVPPPLVSCDGYFEGKVTAYISIMEGCNNYCSYCIVPFVRGREISRPPEDILIEAKSLVKRGIKEITLLGQNVNSYLWKGDETWNFASLLREVGKLGGLLRLRFTTSHPKDLSDELIKCFGYIKNLCPHIHLPFQAGSNRVLERMRRGYTREKYLELVNKLRQVRPDIGITSDVMVGFPSETRKDFEMTLDLIRKVKFDSLFSFIYSDRKGTFAEKMAYKVKESIKAARLLELQSLQKEITLQKNRALEGKDVDVLVEGFGKREGQIMGRTGTNKVVNFMGDNSYMGKLINVKIKRCFINSLQGQVI